MITFVRSLGLIYGIIVWAKLKLNITRSIRIPKIKSPVTLRPRSIDKFTFFEVFIRKDYVFDYPRDFGSPRTIIDAGANIGLTSVFFANKYPEASIFAIEPEVDNFRLLVENTEQYEQVRPMKSALRSKSKLVEVVDRGYGFRGFIVQDVADQGKDSLYAVTVVDILKENSLNAIDILKIDIEGSEKELFEENYDEWLPKVKCLIIELHDHTMGGCSMAFFRAISKYNFSSRILGDKLLLVNEDRRKWQGVV
jgi:FkbM family methyltransferase